MTDTHSNNSALTQHMIFNKTRANSLNDIRTLNMWGYNLKDVSIFQSMPNIEIVSLSMNEISTLKYFSSCMKLKELLLRHNKINNLSEVKYLKNIPALRRLWLAENPIAELKDYRKYVISTLPQLEILDEQPISSEERKGLLYVPLSSQKLQIEENKSFHHSRLLSEKLVSSSYLNPAPTNRRKQRLLRKDPTNIKYESNENIDTNINCINEFESNSSIQLYNEKFQETNEQPKNDEAKLTAVLALLPDLSTNSISIVLDTICKLSK